MSETKAMKPLLVARELLDSALVDLELAEETDDLARMSMAGTKALVAQGLCLLAGQLRARRTGEPDQPSPSRDGSPEGSAVIR